MIYTRLSARFIFKFYRLPVVILTFSINFSSSVTSKRLLLIEILAINRCNSRLNNILTVSLNDACVLF